jgi:hypothetical protein
MNDPMPTKPPSGPMPRRIWLEHRLLALGECIGAYAEHIPDLVSAEERERRLQRMGEMAAEVVALVEMHGRAP